MDEHTRRIIAGVRKRLGLPKWYCSDDDIKRHAEGTVAWEKARLVVNLEDLKAEFRKTLVGVEKASTRNGDQADEG